jgi:hypothetical protein
MVKFAGEQAIMIKGGGKDLEVTDYGLVRVCLSGKRDIFSEIVTRWSWVIVHSIKRVCGHKEIESK